MIVRNAHKKDSPQIARLIVQLGYQPGPSSSIENQIDKHLSSANAAVFVAEEESNIIGFIALTIMPMFHVQANFGRITALCVDFQHREKGIGKKLLAASENYFQSNNCKLIELTSRNIDERIPAHRFYAARGFTEKDSKLFIKELT